MMDVLQINKRPRSDIGSRTTVCDLPDEVLHRILSLLPTRDAVRMIMSSKRFESSWRSVPKLEFHLSCHHTRRDGRLRRLFMDFVERTLQLHDGSPVTVFSLSCQVEYDASRISKWIGDAVVQHNVRDLALSLYPRPSCSYDSFPSCVLRGEGLRKLYLEGSAALWVLRRGHLPNLKDLSIAGVHFEDHESTEKLLSSPSLERLSLNSCSFELLQPIKISAPMLNTVCLGYYQQKEIPDHLVIHAANLKHIVYSGELARRLVISGSPLLDKVVIRPCTLTRHEETASNNLHKLLQEISSVKNELTLSSNLLQQLKRLEDPFTFSPVFSNLRNLKLTGTNNFFLDADPYLDLDVLCPLLRRCPSIETLQFHWDWRLRKEPGERHENLFLPNLKKITIDSFTGSTTTELLTIKFLLVRAPALEELVLTYYSSLSEKPKHLDRLFFNMLLGFPSVELRVV